jgi:hypothetical protein
MTLIQRAATRVARVLLACGFATRASSRSEMDAGAQRGPKHCSALLRQAHRSRTTPTILS